MWIVNTLRQRRRLTLSELSELWVTDEVAEGNPLPRSSFNKYRDAIHDMFGLLIECDKQHNDVSRVEFFDFGLLLDEVSHSNNSAARRFRTKLYIPLLAIFDIAALVLVYIVCVKLLVHHAGVHMLRTACMLRTVCVFAALVLFRQGDQLELSASSHGMWFWNGVWLRDRILLPV